MGINLFCNLIQEGLNSKNVHLAQRKHLTMKG